MDDRTIDDEILAASKAKVDDILPALRAKIHDLYFAKANDPDLKASMEFSLRIYDLDHAVGMLEECVKKLKKQPQAIGFLGSRILALCPVRAFPYVELGTATVATSFGDWYTLGRGHD
jgi:hypothetical protein